MITATSLERLKYETFRRDRKLWGRVLKDVSIETGITGHNAELVSDYAHAKMREDGTLLVYAGTEWDFGTGALDTPAMVRASLTHDMLCHMTNARILPWSVRSEADALLRQQLYDYGPDRAWYNPLRMARWWRWGAVCVYSQLIARWKDKE